MVAILLDANAERVSVTNAGIRMVVKRILVLMSMGSPGVVASYLTIDRIMHAVYKYLVTINR